jgi:eukaryotic-like serine/threonine-protein kinase
MPSIISLVFFTSCMNVNDVEIEREPLSTPTMISGPQPNSNGAMDRANFQGTGVYHTDAIPQPGRLLWKFKTRYGSIESPPSVADGIVYLGANDFTVYAIDSQTGTELWSFRSDYGAMFSPTIADGQLYVSSADENLYVLDSKTGNEVWRFSLHNPRLPWAAFTNPVVAGEVVYVGSARDGLYALDTKTGAIKWHFEAGGSILYTPVLANGRIYFGTRPTDGHMNAYMYAIDSETGSEHWKVPVQGKGINSTTPVVDGLIFLPTWNEGLVALDASTGERRWQFGAGTTILTAPAVAYDTVYLTQDNHLLALNIRDGQERWSFGRSGTGLNSSPIIAGNIVYYLTTDVYTSIVPFFPSRDAGGYLYAVDAHTGKEVWKSEVNGLTGASPTIAHGTLYYGDGEGYLHAMR